MVVFFPLLKVGRLLLPFVVWVTLNLPAYLVVRYLLFRLVEEALRLSSCIEGGDSYFFLGLAVLPIFY